MSPRPHALHARRQLLPFAALLVLALLWAQLLGLAHGVLHVQVSGTPSLAQQEVHPAAPAGLADWLISAADHAQGTDDCRLYDQLGQGGPGADRVEASVVLPPALPVWLALPLLSPRPCASFAARAPPLSR